MISLSMLIAFNTLPDRAESGRPGLSTVLANLSDVRFALRVYLVMYLRWTEFLSVFYVYKY